MPWKIVKNAGSCDESKPYAVVKETDGKVVGCHETREGANEQLRALYVNEPTAAEAIEFVRDRRNPLG